MIALLGAGKGHGPFAGWLSYRAGDIFQEVHEWLAWTMLTVVMMHFAGVIASSRAQCNLLASMLTGCKRALITDREVAARTSAASLLVLVLLSGAFLYFLP